LKREREFRETSSLSSRRVEGGPIIPPMKGEATTRPCGLATLADNGKP
jgi:hypothetical protein